MEQPESASPTSTVVAPPPDVIARPEPTGLAERIEAIDVLRGIVLLGILIININGFGLPYWAIWNPTVAGGHTGINWWAWFGAEVFVEGKMRALFSMLFGAGVILMTQRAESAGPEGRARSADIYYRRMLWLIAFGLIHAYLLLMPGDILYFYGLVGLLLFPLRHLRAGTLIALGLCAVLAEATYSGLDHLAKQEQRDEALVVQAQQQQGTTLTDDQNEKLKEWQEHLDEVRPPQEKIDEMIAGRRAGYGSLVFNQAGGVKEEHSTPLYFLTDIFSMMLIGMGLLRAGIISGRRTKRFYVILAAICLPLGWTAAAISPLAWSRASFDPGYIAPWYFSDYGIYPTQRLLGALGYVGAIRLLSQKASVRLVTGAIASAGRMPLTNYLGQSVIAILIFTGVGLGWFGQFSRSQLLLMTFAIWTVQVLLSAAWLRLFLFGPMEWLWRWLSYGQRPRLMK